MLLKVTVKDEAGEKVWCRLKVCRPEGAEGEPVAEICCGGEHIFAMPQENYRVEASRGKLYAPAACTVRGEGASARADLCLKRVFDPKEWGLYSFDAHSHVSRDEESAAGSLEYAAQVMKSEAFNFFFAGSPYDTDVHYQYLSRSFTDACSYREKYAGLIARMRSGDFIPDIGNEVVKCRYGHMFLMNYIQRPPFSAHYDERYDPWQFAKKGREPGYDILYPYEAIRRERGGNSVAVAAHPTSWWWQDGEFITNIAATVGFDALAGAIDAIVILGYQDERPYYEKLWYELLDNGYFMPGVAETDAAFDSLPGDFLRFRTYAWLEEFSIDALCRAVRAGRCVASSGPVLRMRVDGRLPGSALAWAPGQEFDVDVECASCADGPLASLQIIVGGRVVAEYPARGERFAVRHSFRAEKDSYILAKCRDAAGRVAIASPVYIRNAPFINRGYTSRVRVNVLPEGAEGSWRLDGGETHVFAGGFELRMNPASDLRISAGGRECAVKLFELPELQDIFRNLYTGRFNGGKRYEPGEVPAEEFRIRQVRELLDDVRLEMDMRDGSIRRCNGA
jgi:hypothetical protein